MGFLRFCFECAGKCGILEHGGERVKGLLDFLIFFLGFPNGDRQWGLV